MMKRLPMNLIRTGALIGMLALVVALAGTGPRAVGADDASFDAVADKAWVNKYGGILVEGSWDCTDAVEEAYPNVDDRPDMVLVNVNWVAYQYVGRTKVVHASYDSAIAGACYVKDRTGPYRWYTLSPYPDGDLTWTYSPDGKFAPGRVHFEVEAVGGWAMGGAYPFPDQLYSWSQADLKAVRVN